MVQLGAHVPRGNACRQQTRRAMKMWITTLKSFRSESVLGGARGRPPRPAPSGGGRGWGMQMGLPFLAATFGGEFPNGLVVAHPGRERLDPDPGRHVWQLCN